MNENLNLVSFGKAIEALKEGKRVTRVGWNGKGMFIFMRPAGEIHIHTLVYNIDTIPNSVKEFYKQDIIDENNQEIPKKELSDTDTVKFTAYLCMKAADGTIVNGWLASQTDILAEDWIIL